MDSKQFEEIIIRLLKAQEAEIKKLRDERETYDSPLNEFPTERINDIVIDSKEDREETTRLLEAQQAEIKRLRWQYNNLVKRIETIKAEYKRMLAGWAAGPH